MGETREITNFRVLYESALLQVARGRELIAEGREKKAADLITAGETLENKGQTTLDYLKGLGESTGFLVTLDSGEKIVFTRFSRVIDLTDYWSVFGKGTIKEIQEIKLGVIP